MNGLLICCVLNKIKSILLYVRTYMLYVLVTWASVIRLMCMHKYKGHRPKGEYVHAYILIVN